MKTMATTILLDNGVTHELTADELTVLKIALSDFNDCSLPICSPERDAQYMAALENLKSLLC